MNSTYKTDFKIVSDGLIVFGRKPCHLRTLILSDFIVLEPPITQEVMDIFRCYRIEERKIRHEASNIDFEVDGKSLILSGLYLTPSFGISVALDSELAKFEFQLNEAESSRKRGLQLMSLDGIDVDLNCYYYIE